MFNKFSIYILIVVLSFGLYQSIFAQVEDLQWQLSDGRVLTSQEIEKYLAVSDWASVYDDWYKETREKMLLSNADIFPYLLDLMQKTSSYQLVNGIVAYIYEVEGDKRDFIENLHKRVASENNEMQRIAILGLGALGSDDDLVKLVESASKEPDEKVRYWAVSAVGKKGNPNVVQKLKARRDAMRSKSQQDPLQSGPDHIQVFDEALDKISTRLSEK